MILILTAKTVFYSYHLNVGGAADVFLIFRSIVYFWKFILTMLIISVISIEVSCETTRLVEIVLKPYYETHSGQLWIFINLITTAGGETK